MSPRTGRPTDEPKTNQQRIRLSDKDMEMLNYCCEVTGKTKADIIREGIREIYGRLQNK